MACSFAPHNMNEIMDAIIHVVENSECDVRDLLQFVTGPDFPTGGLIINKDELPNAYLTGKGRARIRGEYDIETKAGRDTIVFKSIPYKVSKEQLAIDIDQLCEEKKIDGVTAIRDESNKDGVRFVIELAKGVSSAPILAKLFKLTRLEDTYSMNQVALVDKKPRLLNLKQLIDIYIDHQKDVLVRKSKFDAEKIANRVHILEGLLIALEDIDNVITLIKKSENSSAAKASLIAKYKLSEAQAKAILDMKLSKLAHIEHIEIQNEKAELLKELELLKAIIANPIPELVRIFKALKATYGDERRSTITQVTVEKEEKEIEYVEPEKCVVAITEGGTIKRIPATSFRTQKTNGKGVRTQEDITSMVLRTNTVDSLMIFTDRGKMYRLLVNDIPVGTNVSKGQSIKSLIAMETDENPTIIYSIYRDTDAKFVLFVTKNGLVKKTALEEYVKTKKKTGIAAITLREGDELVSVALIKDEQIAMVTADGMSIIFNSDEVTPSSRTTSGLKGITLKDGDSVAIALPIRNFEDDLAIFSAGGTAKRVKLKDFASQKRGGKGLVCYKESASAGKIVSAALVSDGDTILAVGEKNSICVNAKEIPVLGRATTGNQILKADKIVSVSKI